MNKMIKIICLMNFFKKIDARYFALIAVQFFFFF